MFKLKFKEEIIYIHNLNFDGFLIIESLSDKTIKFEVFSKNLNLYYIKIKYNDKTIYFKCSYKLLPISLEKISLLFNLNKKMIFPYKFINENTINYIGSVPDSSYFNSYCDYENFLKFNLTFNVKEYTILYCFNDVFITYFFLENIFKILKKFKINIKKIMSAPSLSLNLFINNFNENKIKFTNNNLIDKFARNSYFGGRCEVYGNPYLNKHIFHFDFSGMYAQCMSEKFPYGKYKINTNVKEINEPGMYWIEYESKKINRPVLPHHRINDKKLMFCNGLFKGVFWFEEIDLFLKKGGKINKILYSLTFENYDFIFKDYVDFFTNLRKENNEFNLFGKLMINSIYGRLGMRDINSFSFIEKKENFDKIKNKINIMSFKELNNIVLIEAEMNKNLEKFLKIKQNKTKNNIIIASAITSKARIKLYNAQDDVIKNGGRLLYSDTDSIFAEFDKDVSNEKHGEVY